MKRIPISLVIIILLTIILSACASEPLTSYEIQDRYNRTVLEYKICLAYAERIGVPWVVYHRGPYNPRKEKSYLEMSTEMAQNGCKVRYR